MEKKELIEEIESAAIEAGISRDKINNSARPTYLPQSGKFVSWKIDGERNFAHIRVLTEDNNSISVGTLKALAFFGDIKDAKFVNRDNKFYLTGVKPVNPHIGGKMAEVAANLIGRNFKATPAEAVVLRFNETGYSSAEEAMENLVVKTFYKVELK